jgi:hypothetical protein
MSCSERFQTYLTIHILSCPSFCLIIIISILPHSSLFYSYSSSSTLPSTPLTLPFLCIELHVLWHFPIPFLFFISTSWLWPGGSFLLTTFLHGSYIIFPFRLLFSSRYELNSTAVSPRFLFILSFLLLGDIQYFLPDWTTNTDTFLSIFSLLLFLRSVIWLERISLVWFYLFLFLFSFCDPLRDTMFEELVCACI